MEQQIHNRRHFLALSAAALAMELPGLGEARTLDRPARLMVGFPAGSSPGFVARLLAEHTSATTHRPSSSRTDREPAAGFPLKP
jgi:tripartite-type tricarboxylate transporter receptor subunit TctC